MARFSLEHLFELWDDDNGSRIEIGPDRDGLNLVEIREKDEKSNFIARITMTAEQALLAAAAIKQVAEDSKQKGTTQHAEHD